MASVSSSPCSPQAVLPVPLPLQLQLLPRCRLPRLPLPPLGLSAGARRGGGLLLPLTPPAPRAADGNDGRAVAKEEEVEGDSEQEERGAYDGARDTEGAGASKGSGRFAADYVSLGIREPVYEVCPERAPAGLLCIVPLQPTHMNMMNN
jgi:magnesium transporter